MAKKTEKTYNYDKKSPFVFDGNTVFIPCTMNATTHFLSYNSTMNVSLHEQIFGNAEFPKCNKTMKLKIKNNSNHRTVIKAGLKYYNIESDFFSFKNFLSEVVSVSKDTITSKCTFEQSPSRFTMGRTAFPDRTDAMLLSFSDTTITLFDSNYEYDTTDFTLVKSLNTCRGLDIFLTIDSIEHAFIFDTGYEGCISLPQNKMYQKCSMVNGKTQCDYVNVLYEKHRKENDISVVECGKSTLNLDFLIDTLIVQQTNTIMMGDLASITGNILYKQRTARPVIGMEFISHFDWIIDVSNGKIYAKQIKNINSFLNPYRVSMFNTTLQISSLPVDTVEYQLFSVIDSVNEVKVDANNICQMMELLNKENGFKDNKIAVLIMKQ
jgi:hypothetical protein